MQGLKGPKLCKGFNLVGLGRLGLPGVKRENVLKGFRVKVWIFRASGFQGLGFKGVIRASRVKGFRGFRA